MRGQRWDEGEADIGRGKRAGFVGLPILLAVVFAVPASAWRDVFIYPWGFSPDRVTLEHESLHFTNETELPARVISDEGLFDSGDIPPGGGFSLRTEIFGTHSYHSADGATAGSFDVPRRTLDGPEGDLAADHIPDVPFPEAAESDRVIDGDLGISVSRTRILLTFAPGTTVSDANGILASGGAAIIGGIPDLGVLLLQATGLSARNNALRNLRADSRVEAAAKDLEVEAKTIPRPAAPFSVAGVPAAWTWGVFDPSSPPGGGDNWHLEADRAPQAWNLLAAIAAKRPTTATAVIDDAADTSTFDLRNVRVHRLCQTAVARCTDTTPGEHGTHVAGTIGGGWDDNAADAPFARQPLATGIDGINPVANLNSIGDSFTGRSPSYADELTIFDSVLDEVRPGGALQQLRAINYSVALPVVKLAPMQARHPVANCGPGAADDGLAGSTQHCSMENDDVWLTELANIGAIARRIAERASDLDVLIVQAAGNESNDFCAPLSGTPGACTYSVVSGQSSAEFIWASKRWTSPKANPIVGVEAIGDSSTGGAGLMRADFSNDGGDISAPGVGIVSTGLGGTFESLNGTSMATPQVTGAITYLLAYKPDLTIAEVKSALLDWARADTTGHATQSPGRTPQPRLDLFASLMSLPGAVKDLVDVNDRTKDGNQRVVRHATPPHPVLEREAIKPDGVVDMRDFRAFRDAWLQGCAYTPADTACPADGDVILDGGPTHPKRDANLDGCVAAQPPVAACPTPENELSRFDFNGDGRLDRLPARFPVGPTGALAAPPGTFMTDLDVLLSAFRSEPAATEGWTKADLSGLMESGDLEIHADDLLDRGAGDVEITITADGTPLPTRHLKPTGDRTKDYIVATVPSFKSLEVRGSASIAGETVETALASTTMFNGEDERLDLCQRVSLVASPARVPADGSSTVKLRLEARTCKPTDEIAGKTIAWTLDKSSASLTQMASATGADGRATAVFTAGSAIDTYTVTAEVELGGGQTQEVSARITTTPRLTIAYLWRQSIDEWQEAGSTRWTAPPPGMPDCTLAGVEYCLDGFEIQLESQAGAGLTRSGTLTGGGSSFEVTEQVSDSLTRSRATWTVANADGSTETGTKLSSWQVLDPGAYVDAPVEELVSDDAADGLHLQGLHAVGDLPYHYGLFGSLAEGTIDPVELHAARIETLLIPQATGDEIRFAGHPEQEVVFPRNPDGTLAPFQSCGVKEADLATSFGYRVAGDAGAYLPGAMSVGRKTTFVAGDRPMPVGPGRLRVSYAFGAIASYAGAPAPPPTLPDCSVPHPPDADFAGPAATEEGQRPQFRDRSADVDNDIVRWAWDFGDGEPGQTGPNPYHAFPDDGTYTVTLTVTDAQGLTDSAQQQVVVSNRPPEAHIEDAEAPAGAPVSVTWGMVDAGKVDKTQLVWSLGSTTPGIAPLGGTEAAQEAALELPGTLPAGIYPLVLRVTDKDGGTTTAEATLTLTPGPSPVCDPVTGQNCPPPPPPTAIVCAPGVALDAEETTFFNLVNAYRIQNGVPPLLGISPTLTTAAAEHAHDMAVNGYMDHTGLDGRGPGERAWDALYPRTAAVGENLATGAVTGSQALFAWRASTAGHDENMLDPRWKAVGIAREQGSEWRWATSYGTVLDCPPAAPAPSAAPVGARAGSSDDASGGGTPEAAAAPAAAPLTTGDGATVVTTSAADEVSSKEAPDPDAGFAIEQLRSFAAATAAEADLLPVPAFTLSDVSPLEQQALTFTNVSRDADGTPMGGTLDFGDGSPHVALAPGESVVHRYATDTYLNARLTATSAAGSLTVDRWLLVESRPTPHLTYTGDAEGFVGKDVTLRALAKTWLFGEAAPGLEVTFTVAGITATAVTGADGQAEATVTLTGVSAGFHTVAIAFAGNDEYGEANGFGSLEVLVNAPPVAEAGGPYLSGVGNTLLLDGSRSREPDFGDAIAAYAWDLDGDGEHDDAEGRTPLPVAWATVQTLVCGGVCLTDHDYPLSLRVTDLRGDHGSDTATVRFTADFALFLGGEGKTIVPGASNSFGVTVVGSDGFTEPVALSIAGLPADVTASFSVNPAPPGSVSVLTITAAPGALTGSFPVVVTGTAAGITHTVGDELRVAFGLIPVCFGTIGGGVTDSETGAPVSGVNVLLDGVNSGTVTDASGRFTFHDVRLGHNNAPAAHYLLTGKAGYWESLVTTTAYCGATSNVDLTVLRKANGLFSGKVVKGVPSASDSSVIVPTATPIPGATVAVNFPGPTLTTGPDGTYAGEVELGQGNTPAGVGVRASAPGYWPQDKGVTLEQDLPKTLDFELVEQCTGRIRGGRVLYVDDAGLPTDEAAPFHAVKLFTSFSGFVTVQSDAEGRFDFDREVLLGHNNAPTAYRLQPVPSSADPPGSFGLANDLPLAACGDEAHGDVWIKKGFEGFATLEGLVYDEETGAPVPDAFVANIHQFGGGAVADGAGRYRAENISLGFLQTTAFRFPTATKEGYYPSPFQQVFLEHGKVATADFPLLRKRFGTLVGSVTDVVTGAPIPEARLSDGGIFCFPATICQKADRNGNYVQAQIALGNRNAPTAKSVTAFATDYWSITQATTIEADRTSRLDYRLLRKCTPARIVGSVVNAETQAPIQGAHVSGGGAAAVTDAAGRFEIASIQPGFGNNPTQVFLTASAGGFFSQSKTVTIFCGATITVDFGARVTSAGILVGTVTNADTGAPISGVFVGTEFGGSATTDAAGGYRIEGVPLGDLDADRDWRVTVSPAGFKPQTAVVTAQAGVEARADFSFTLAGNELPVAQPQSATMLEDVESYALTLAGSDADGDPLSFSVLTFPQHGTLTVSGATANYRPDRHAFGPDSFTFVVHDGQDTSAPATVDLTVLPVNDQPFAQPDFVTADEDTPLAIPIADILANDLDQDGDSDTLTLTHVLPHGNTFGEVVLAADHVLYTPETGFTGQANFRYRISDGAGLTSESNVFVEVVRVPGPPDCPDAAFAGLEDEPLAGAVTCTDGDGDPLAYSVVDAPAHGSLSFGADGTFTYFPQEGYAGPDAFTFRASDGSADSRLATVTLTIVAVNVAPTALGDAYPTSEDTPLVVAAPGLLGNDSDSDGDALSASLTTPPAHGSLSLGADGAFTYQPDADYQGPDSFAYAASDGTLLSTPVTVSIDVAAVNDAPVALADAYELGEGETLTVPAAGVLANDTDAEGDPLTAELVAGPGHGTVLLGADGSLSYTPAPGHHGADSFEYRARDAADASPAVTVTLRITPAALPPSAVPDAYAATEDEALTVAAPGVLGNDAGTGPLRAELESPPAHGTLALALDGSFVYVPAPDADGVDSFAYRAAAGALRSPPVEVTVTVAPVNDAPVADPVSASTDEDTPLGIALSGSDVDGDALELAVVVQPAHGRLSGSGASLTYTPDPDYHGPDSFRYVASDGSLESSPATVTLSVLPVNDAPVAHDLAGSTDEDASVAVVLAGTDVDGDALAYSVVTGPAHGSLSLSGASATYTPDGDYHGPDAFTYRAADATLDSNVATVSIAVAPVNDRPHADAQSALTEEDTPLVLVLSGSDVDGDALAYSVVTEPAHGSLSGSGALLTYLPDPDYHGPDSFGFRTHDGVLESEAATVSIAVEPVNDAPLAADAAVSTAEDTAVGVTLTGSDVDGDALGFEVLSGPAHGGLAGSGADRTYTPDPNYSGPDSFTYAVDDGTLASAPATISLTVSAVNDAPIADDRAVATLGGVPVPVVLAGSDPDGDALTFAVAEGPSDGVLTGVGPSLVYTPAVTFTGEDSFTYVASDGTTSSVPATVTITVGPAPPPPNLPPLVALAAAGPLDEGGTVTLVASASDPDEDALTYQWTADLGTIVSSGASAVLAAADGPALVHVVVSVSDGHDHVVTDSQTVAVRNLPPAVSVGPAAAQPWGVDVPLSGSVTDPSPADAAAGLQPRWAFGDGAGAGGTSSSHSYSAPGQYIATLSATDKDGGSGSASTTVTIGKRPAALAYTGDVCSAFGSTVLSARLTDGIGGAGLPGRAVSFDLAGARYEGVTEADGRVTIAAAALPQGSVEVAFAGDDLFLAAAHRATLRIGTSTGRVTGGGLRAANGGRGGFTVDGGRAVKGELQWQRPGLSFHAHLVTALGISPDGRSAWFAGRGTDGRPFTAAVEDRGEPGRNDRFRLWIDGVLQTPAIGAITGGNVQIHSSGQVTGCGAEARRTMRLGRSPASFGAHAIELLLSTP